MFEEIIRDFFINMAYNLKQDGYFILNDMKTKFGNYPSLVDNVIFESDSEDDNNDLDEI